MQALACLRDDLKRAPQRLEDLGLKLKKLRRSLKADQYWNSPMRRLFSQGSRGGKWRKKKLDREAAFVAQSGTNFGESRFRAGFATAASAANLRKAVRIM
jgi:hypothetical protein